MWFEKVFVFTLEANIGVPERNWSPKGALKDEFPDFWAYKDGSNIGTKTFLNPLKPHQNPTNMSPNSSPI